MAKYRIQQNIVTKKYRIQQHMWPFWHTYSDSYTSYNDALDLIRKFKKIDNPPKENWTTVSDLI